MPSKSVREINPVALICVAAVVVVVSWGLWAWLGAPAVENWLCAKDKDACSRLGQVGDLFGGINALFAGFAFAGLAVSIELGRRSAAEDRRLVHDKELVEQVTRSYGWAFESFLGGATETGPANPSRLGWLTAARHLVRAKAIGANIQTEVYRTIWQEVEDHWRVKFHRALGHHQYAQIEFFIGWISDGLEMQHEYIEPRSALIIADFARWKDGKTDPIESIEIASLFQNINRSKFVGRGLLDYLERDHPELYKQYERMQSQKPL